MPEVKPSQQIMSLNSAELYDPATGIWSMSGNLNTARVHHTATLLPGGKVLVVGGFGDNESRTNISLNTTELYDPATATWSIVANLITARGNHTATLLPSGNVLVVVGDSGTVRPGHRYVEQHHQSQHNPNRSHSDTAAEWQGSGRKR